MTRQLSKLSKRDIRICFEHW